MKVILAVFALVLLAGILLNAPAEQASAWITEQPASLEQSAPEEGSQEESKDLPWVPVLIIALAIPAAVLVVPSFFGKRGSGGH
jgi:hypothetical protein